MIFNGQEGWNQETSEGIHSSRSSQHIRDKKIVVRTKNSSVLQLDQKDIEGNGPSKERLCGCDSYCIIF